MKVLHIITGNDNGGGAKHVLNICKYATNFENILGCVGEGYLYENAIKENIDVKLFQNKIYNNQIINFINENKIDIVNFHGAKAFLIHRVIKNKINAKTLASVHSDYRYDFLNNKIKYAIFTPLSKYGLKSFDNYMCISNYIKEVLDNNNFKGNKAVANNGIDKAEFKITVSREEIRKNYNISEEDFVFSITGRLHPIKNHETLIRAFKKLSNEIKDIKLLVVGDGPLEADLKKLSNDLSLDDKVIFTGFIDKPINIVNASDISVITSFNEGGSPPLVVLESALVKKTVISSKVGDIDINFDKDMIFIINENTEKGVLEGMTKAYEKKNQLLSMGEKLYEEVIENYTVEKFCNTYYDFYKNI